MLDMSNRRSKPNAEQNILEFRNDSEFKKKKKEKNSVNLFLATNFSLRGEEESPPIPQKASFCVTQLKLYTLYKLSSLIALRELHSYTL